MSDLNDKILKADFFIDEEEELEFRVVFSDDDSSDTETGTGTQRKNIPSSLELSDVINSQADYERLKREVELEQAGYSPEKERRVVSHNDIASITSQMRHINVLELSKMLNLPPDSGILINETELPSINLGGEGSSSHLSEETGPPAKKLRLAETSNEGPKIIDKTKEKLTHNEVAKDKSTDEDSEEEL